MLSAPPLPHHVSWPFRGVGDKYSLLSSWRKRDETNNRHDLPNDIMTIENLLRFRIVLNLILLCSSASELIWVDKFPIFTFIELANVYRASCICFLPATCMECCVMCNLSKIYSASFLTLFIALPTTTAQ